MTVLRPTIPPLLSDEQLQRIHDAALETIERVGMYCDRPDVLERLRALEAIHARAERHFRGEAGAQ